MAANNPSKSVRNAHSVRAIDGHDRCGGRSTSEIWQSQCFSGASRILVRFVAYDGAICCSGQPFAPRPSRPYGGGRACDYSTDSYYYKRL